MTERVRSANALVHDLESLSPRAWDSLCAHPKYDAFMREYHQAKCLTNFWYHLQYVVYFRAMRHYSQTLHGEAGLSGWIQNWTREEHGQRIPVHLKFLIMAREHCKTQFAIAYQSWEFARDPNNRLLIRAYKDPKAYEILQGLKQLLRMDMYTKTYPWVRPMLTPRGTEVNWSRESILLERDDIGIRVPSVEAVGIEADPTGGHFTRGLYDDYEVRKNANSDTLRQQMIETFQNDSNLFLAGSHRLFCGTPWGKHGLIQMVRERRGPFEGHEYDILEQAAEVKALDRVYSGSEPILQSDRVTFLCGGAGFPTISENMSLCQARIRFFAPGTKAIIEEVREIVWNDANHFRVNRAIPTTFNQPVSYVIGTNKPACPERFTLDSIDLLPSVEDTDTHIARSSLVKKRIEQGSSVYAAQMLLSPLDPTSMILNPSHYRRITPDQIPAEGLRVWYRSVDFASNKMTRACTAMTTGFWHKNGLYITDIIKENQMSNTEKILRLLLGELRVRELGGRIRFTTFEKAAIEDTLADFLSEAERDPHAFFMRYPRYRQYAEEVFAQTGPIHMSKRTLPRSGMMAKNERILSMQPLLEAERIFIVVGAGFVSESGWDALWTETEAFRMDSDDSSDVLDTLRDLVVEGKEPVSHTEGKSSRPGMFQEVQRKARLRRSLGKIGMVA